MHERANPLDMTDDSLDGRRPIAVALDLDIVGTHVTHRRDILSIGVLWDLDVEVPQAGVIAPFPSPMPPVAHAECL